MYIILRHQLTIQVGRMSTINLVEPYWLFSTTSARSSAFVCCKESASTLARLLQPRASFTIGRRWHSPKIPNNTSLIVDSATFETVCSDTLESLCEYFEELIEKTAALKYADVTLGDGVLTVNFGPPHGTYVINRQSPNRQIWLSSPTSGPKRYDFVSDIRTMNKGYWVYRHDGVTLHQLLQEELGTITGRMLDFSALPHSHRPKNA